MDEREKRALEIRQTRQQEAQKRRQSGPRTDNTMRKKPRPDGSVNRTIRTTGKKGRRKSRRARRRRRNFIIRMLILVALIILAVGGLFFWKKYGSSKKQYDLKKYYGLENENDLAVMVNNQVIGRLDDYHSGGKIYDGVPYIEYSVVRDFINERFYWDFNENILLYTLPSGNVSVGVGEKEYSVIKEKKSKDYVILKAEGKTAYIALPFIEQFSNMEYKLLKAEGDRIPTRAVITCDFGEHTVATMKKDTPIRYQGGVKSPILTEVKKGDKVRIVDQVDGWKKIRTEEGFSGYVKENTLRRPEKETTSHEFQEPKYTNIKVDKPINMAWHNVDNEDANGYVLENIARTKGLTIIAPTWFSIANTEGAMSSIASTEYVNYAHQSKLEVWGVLRDFHGGINSYDETYEVLSYTSKRENLINQVIGAAIQTGLDGINLDFELISPECGEHYIQFVRELSVKCRQNGLVFSISNYVPMPYNKHYDLKEQGIVADYVVIMGYDEHAANSYEAGSVASYDYVKNGIEDALKEVPNDKLVNAIPFFTRLWLERPKTEEEIAEDQGTEAENYPLKVTNTALGMDAAEKILKEAGVTPKWDKKTRQNYAQWDTEDGTYKIWLEDTQSIEEKLKLIKEHNLAGVASWCIGWEKQQIWDLILQYVN